MNQGGQRGQYPGACRAGSYRDQSESPGSKSVETLQQAVDFLVETVTNVHETLKNLDPGTLPCPPPPCPAVPPSYTPHYNFPQFFPSGPGPPPGYPIYFFSPHATPSQFAPPISAPPQFFYPPSFTSQSYPPQRFSNIYTSDYSARQPRSVSVGRENSYSSSSPSETSLRRSRRSTTCSTQTCNTEVSARKSQRTSASSGCQSERPTSQCISQTHASEPCVPPVGQSESTFSDRRSSESGARQQTNPRCSLSRPSTPGDTGTIKPYTPQLPAASPAPSRSGSVRSRQLNFCYNPLETLAELCPSQTALSQQRLSNSSKQHSSRLSSSYQTCPRDSKPHHNQTFPIQQSSETNTRKRRSSSKCSPEEFTPQSSPIITSPNHLKEGSFPPSKPRVQVLTPPQTSQPKLESTPPTLASSETCPQERCDPELRPLKFCDPSPRTSDVKVISHPSLTTCFQIPCSLQTYSPQSSRPRTSISDYVAKNSHQASSSCPQKPCNTSPNPTKSSTVLASRSSTPCLPKTSPPRPSPRRHSPLIFRSCNSRSDLRAPKSHPSKSCPPQSRTPTPSSFQTCNQQYRSRSHRSRERCPPKTCSPTPSSIPSCPPPCPPPSQACQPKLRSEGSCTSTINSSIPVFSSTSSTGINSRSCSSTSVCVSPLPFDFSTSPPQSSCPLSTALQNLYPPPPNPPTPPCVSSPCSRSFSPTRDCSASRSTSSLVICYPPPPLPPCPSTISSYPSSSLPSRSVCSIRPRSAKQRCSPASQMASSNSYSLAGCRSQPSTSTSRTTQSPRRVSYNPGESLTFSRTPRGICTSSGIQGTSEPSFTGVLYSTPSRARPIVQRPTSCITCDLAGVDLPQGGSTTCANLGVELLQATEEGRFENVQELLNAGVNVDYTCRNSELTPLHRAARRCNCEIVGLLIQCGANIHARTQFGFTPLHIAAYNDLRASTVSMLISAGADVNQPARTGRTPLHYAAEVGNAAGVQALLAAGARKDLTNCNGETPYDVAGSNHVRQLLCG